MSGDKKENDALRLRRFKEAEHRDESESVNFKNESADLNDLEVYQAVLPQFLPNSEDQLHRGMVKFLLSNETVEKKGRIAGKFLEELFKKTRGKIDDSGLKETIDSTLSKSNDEKLEKAKLYIEEVIKPIFAKNHKYQTLLDKLLAPKEDGYQRDTIETILKKTILNSKKIELEIKKEMELEQQRLREELNNKDGDLKEEMGKLLIDISQLVKEKKKVFDASVELEKKRKSMDADSGFKLDNIKSIKIAINKHKERHEKLNEELQKLNEEFQEVESKVKADIALLKAPDLEIVYKMRGIREAIDKNEDAIDKNKDAKKALDKECGEAESDLKKHTGALVHLDKEINKKDKELKLITNKLSRTKVDFSIKLKRYNAGLEKINQLDTTFGVPEQNIQERIKRIVMKILDNYAHKVDKSKDNSVRAIAGGSISMGMGSGI